MVELSLIYVLNKFANLVWWTQNKYTISKRRLKVYRKTYPKFKYDSPFATPKENFNTSNLSQYEASPSGEA
jgi:hypothetical protein